MTAQELREKFERDLEELQKKCKHEKSEKVLWEYGPGHYGEVVNLCVRCEKVLG